MTSPACTEDDTIAVIIVSYCCADLTLRCLDSLAEERANGRPAGLKVVVVDNASGDALPIARAIAEHHREDWITLVRASENGGFGYGNNLGAAAARQLWPVKWFYFLNPDTQVQPGAITTLRHFLATRPLAGLAGSSFLNQDGSDWPFAFRFPGMLSEFEHGLSFRLVSRLLQKHCVAKVMRKEAALTDWVSGASVMVRTATFDALQGFDEGFFLYFEETDLCLRARKAGWQTWYVPDSVVMHVAGQSTGVGCRNQQPRRLPAYWYASRRYYYLCNHGKAMAAMIDIATLLAHGLGRLKRRLQGRSIENVPHFLGDLWAHSILRNRHHAAERVWRRQSPVRSP